MNYLKKPLLRNEHNNENSLLVQIFNQGLNLEIRIQLCCQKLPNLHIDQLHNYKNVGTLKDHSN